MEHTTLAVRINAMLPLTSKNSYAVQIDTMCTCGERVSNMYELPPIADLEDGRMIIRDFLMALVEEL